MKFHFPIVNISFKVKGVPLRKSFPHRCHAGPPTFSSSSVSISGFTWSDLIHLELIFLCSKIDNGFFYTFTCRCPSIIYWGCCLFSSMCFGIFVKYLIALLMWILTSMYVCLCHYHLKHFMLFIIFVIKIWSAFFLYISHIQFHMLVRIFYFY